MRMVNYEGVINKYIQLVWECQYFDARKPDYYYNSDPILLGPCRAMMELEENDKYPFPVWEWPSTREYSASLVANIKKAFGLDLPFSPVDIRFIFQRLKGIIFTEQQTGVSWQLYQSYSKLDAAWEVLPGETTPIRHLSVELEELGQLQGLYNNQALGVEEKALLKQIIVRRSKTQFDETPLTQLYLRCGLTPPEPYDWANWGRL